MTQLFSRTHLTKGTILVLSSLIGYFFNFLFNAYLGRVLPLDEFALIALLTSIWYIIVIVLNALSASVNHEAAYLHKKKGAGEAFSYYTFFSSKAMVFSVVLAVIWVVITPVLLSFFHLQNFSVMAMFAPLIVLGALASVNRGYLQATLSFTFLSITVLVESISRFILAVFFVTSGNPDWAYLSLPLSIILGFGISVYLARRDHYALTGKKDYAFPRHFFLIMLLTNISSTAFLTLDIVLVKHYFSAFLAGAYALLALIGKIIYFLGTLLNSILFTVVSRKREQGRPFFYMLLLGTLCILSCSFLAFGVFGNVVTPILFGDKVVVIFPFLFHYTLGMCLFTLSSAFVLFHLVLKQYLFAVISSAMAVALAFGILLFHDNLFQIVNTILIISATGLSSMVFFHLRFRRLPI